MQTAKDNAPKLDGWELIKIILIGFFVLVAFGWAGKTDQEFKKAEAEATHQILLENGIITE